MIVPGQLVARFLLRLKSHGLRVPGPIKIEQIQSFETRERVQLPMDMVEFFLHVDGMVAGDVDPENHLRISSLDEIRTLPSILPEYSRSIIGAESAFVIGDFLLWSFGYATWLSSTPVASSPIYVVGDGAPIRIADTFAEFLAMYIDSSPGLVPRRA